uniref:Uncharacterized protein n=1 Tax=Glossina brevipalpis TaxID=37001 RepID=A0A1A9W7M8_9MUSC
MIQIKAKVKYWTGKNWKESLRLIEVVFTSITVRCGFLIFVFVLRLAGMENYMIRLYIYINRAKQHALLALLSRNCLLFVDRRSHLLEIKRGFNEKYRKKLSPSVVLSSNEQVLSVIYVQNQEESECSFHPEYSLNR